MPARSHPVTRDQVEQQLNKTGGTPFAIRNFSLEYSGDLFAPLAGLNRVRREFLARAEEMRLLTKLQANRARIESFEVEHAGDAEVLVVAIGISARAAKRAVAASRARGIRAGLFRPITLWPFPEDALRAAAARARVVLVPELNAGQLVLEVERVLRGHRVVGLNRYDGEPITPQQIAARSEELAQEAR